MRAVGREEKGEGGEKEEARSGELATSGTAGVGR